MGQEQLKRSSSDAGVNGLMAATIQGSMVILIALGALTGLIGLLILGCIKLVTGDYPPGFIMLLAVGFVLSIFAGWRFQQYQGQFAVLGMSMLTMAGIIWAVFEDGIMGKAFMLMFVITAGSMAAFGFYNLFIKKREPNMPG